MADGHQQHFMPVISVDDTLNAAVDDALDTPTEWAELGVELGELAAFTSPPPSRQESPLTEYSAHARCQCIEVPPVYARDIREVNTKRSSCFTIDALAVAMKRHILSPDIDDMISLLRHRHIHQQAFCERVKERFGPDVLINALHEIRMAVTIAENEDAQGDEKPEAIKADVALMPDTREAQLVPAGRDRPKRKRHPGSLEHGGLPSRSSKALRPKHSPDHDDLELCLEPLRPCPISALEPLKAQPCDMPCMPAHAAAA